MANVRNVERMGTDLVVRLDDGRIVTCVSTGGILWTPTNGGGYGPDPGDPDPDADGFAWPFPLSCVSSEYGPRSGRIHQGIDMASVGTGEAFPGADIPASNGGIIHAAYYHANFGNHVVINHGVIGGRQLYTLYAHMVNASPFSQGDTIDKLDVVGQVGNTGASYGAHLHFETHVANPGGTPTWSNPGTHINPRDFMATYGETV